MSTNKRKIILNKVSVKLGCSSSICRRLKLSQIFNPKPKPPPPTPTHHHRRRLNHSSSSTSSLNNSTTTTTFSPTTPPPRYYEDWETNIDSSSSTCQKSIGAFGRAGGENVAVEKESYDPYVDFRHSMLQMIMENQIYTKKDLRELLNCFLQLNSPCHHEIIIRAFYEIWNSVFSNKLRSGF